MLVEAILENLQIGNPSSSTNSNSFCIADFSCSVGPNTFNAVNNIIETITQKFEIEGHSSLLPEFHVYFNDHVSNDFNILFSNLPQNRQYYAAEFRVHFMEDCFLRPPSILLTLHILFYGFLRHHIYVIREGFIILIRLKKSVRPIHFSLQRTLSLFLMLEHKKLFLED